MPETRKFGHGFLQSCSHPASWLPGTTARDSPESQAATGSQPWCQPQELAATLQIRVLPVMHCRFFKIKPSPQGVLALGLKQDFSVDILQHS